MAEDLLIIIPIYNEEEAIGQLIDQIRRSKIDQLGDLLVIDDGSTDQSRAIVEAKGVKVLQKPFNLGYGSTLQLGYKYALAHDYDYVIQIDGDGQHDIANIKTIYEVLVKERDAPDIVIGSRFLSSGNEMHPSFLKKMALSFFRQTIYFFTRQRISDPTSGLQGLNRKTFSYYAQEGHFDYQYPDINMLIQMLLKGCQIQEVPAVMYERKTGHGMHDGVIKPIKYMLLMSLSTFIILIRHRQGFKGLKESREEEGKKHLSVQRYLTLSTIVLFLLVMMFIIIDLEGFVRGEEASLDERETIMINESVEDKSLVPDELQDELLIVEGKDLETAKDWRQTKKKMTDKKAIIFSNLPSPAFIKKHQLEDFFGIQKINGQSKQENLHLIDGFFLGGYYEIEAMDYPALNLELDFTSKVFAFAENPGEEQTPIIWRTVNDEQELYLINGPFMATKASAGMMTALLSQIKDDYLYPVLNSRLMVYEHFPYLSDFNKKDLEKNYNRDAMKVQHDIFFPDVLSINKNRGFIPNGFFSGGFQGEDLEPSPYDERQLKSYQEQINSDGGELALTYDEDIKNNQTLYQELFDQDQVKALLIDRPAKKIETVLDQFPDLELVVGPLTKKMSFQRLNEQAVYLPISLDGINQTGQEELNFLAMVTAYGSITQRLDFESILDPEDGKEKWTATQKAYLEFIDQYRERFNFLTDRNLTETTQQLKALFNQELAVDYEKNRIVIESNQKDQDFAYILRTDKAIQKIEKGKSQKIEEGAYLIHAQGQKVTIILED